MKVRLLLLILGLSMAGCSLVYQLTGYGTDARPYVSEGGDWIPLVEIVPPANAEGGVLTIEAVDHTVLGIEGYVVFARLASEDGAAVMDARIHDDRRRVTVLPGAYALTAYYRTCDGNCGYLDPARELCTADVSVAEGAEVVVTISVANRVCTVS